LASDLLVLAVHGSNIAVDTQRERLRPVIEVARDEVAREVSG